MVTVSDFKARASDWLRRIAHPLVITQNGKPAGVLLSPAAFDELSERQQFLAAVQEGMADEQAGRGHTTDEVFAMGVDLVFTMVSTSYRHTAVGM